MMNKKTKRLYQRMQYGINEKQGQVTNLIEKRKRIEEEGEGEVSKVLVTEGKNSKGPKQNKK